MTRFAEGLHQIMSEGECRDEGAQLRVRPKSRDALRDCMRYVAEHGGHLCPEGAGLFLRAPATKSDPQKTVHLELGGLQRILAQDSEDFVVEAEAGIRIDALTHALEQHSQELGTVLPATATLGGQLAIGREGPWRSGRGAFCHQVLGLEVYLADGTPLRLGGRVLKNVSGYDLMRLFIGTRGSLGVIASATLRTYPRPEVADTLLLPCEDLDDALELGARIRRGRLEPFALHVATGDLLQHLDAVAPAALLISLRGHAREVESLAESLSALHRGPLAKMRLDLDLKDLLAGPIPIGWDELRIAVRPSQLGPLLQELRHLLPGEDSLSGRRLLIDLNTGLLHLGLREGLSLDEDSEQALGERLQLFDASVDFPRDPHFHARRFRNFPATRPGGAALMRALKQKFDAKGCLNPGRHELLR